MDVEVLGSGFDNGSRADWALDGVVDPAKIRTNSTTYVSSTKLIANITIAADAPLAYYDVIVTATSGKKGIGTEMFEVTQAESIGTLGGTTLGFGINDRGQVVGYSMLGGVQHAIVWRAGSAMQSLGPGTAFEIDAPGTTIVGVSDYDPSMAVNDYKAVVWTAQGDGAWQMVALPSSGAGGGARAIATAPDGSLLVVGRDRSAGSRKTRVDRAVLWTRVGGVWRLPEILPTPGGGGHAHDVNSNGQVVGWGDDGKGGNSAFVWERAQDGKYHATALSRLPGPGINAAYAITGAGDIIVGQSDGKPVSWRKVNGIWSSAIALETLGGKCGRAMDINNAGYIVGLYCWWTPDGVAHRLGGLGNLGETIQCEAISNAPGAVAAGAAGHPTGVGAIWRLD